MDIFVIGWMAKTFSPWHNCMTGTRVTIEVASWLPDRGLYNKQAAQISQPETASQLSVWSGKRQNATTLKCIGYCFSRVGGNQGPKCTWMYILCCWWVPLMKPFRSIWKYVLTGTSFHSTSTLFYAGVCTRKGEEKLGLKLRIFRVFALRVPLGRLDDQTSWYLSIVVSFFCFPCLPDWNCFVL